MSNWGSPVAHFSRSRAQSILEVTWPADMICIGWCCKLVQSLDGQACDWLPQSCDQVSNKFLSRKKSIKRRLCSMYLGTIYKLRGQEDMHTWSEEYPFLSTFRVEILSTHIHKYMVKNWQYFVQIVCECPLTYYRVYHYEDGHSITLWQVEICMLDLVWRLSWIAEMWEFMKM